MNYPRDPASVRRQLVGWLDERLRESGMRGAVFGLSGGIDSAVVCGLCAEALGPERCLGLVLPIESVELDARLALAVAERFGVEAIAMPLDDAYHALHGTLESRRERAERAAGGAADANGLTAPIVTDSADALARANLKPRLRMTALYYFANLLAYAVVGTGNRAELTVGYFTKWGDGAADLCPLADLLKREVRDLALELGVPDEVVQRPPSAGLWPGQTDETELGLSYDQIDRYLATGSSGDPTADAEIERRNRLSRHKVLADLPAPRPS